MVSVIAKNIRNRRQHKALCELFDKADSSRDGKISIKEYVDMCETYGVELRDEDIREVLEIADEHGEVRKNDFILHIKNANLSKHFECADPESELHWNNLAVTAFKLFDKNYDGYIDKKEFRWMTSSERFSKKTIDIVFERCDLDGDGKLDYQEFKAMILRSKHRKEEIKRKKGRNPPNLGEETNYFKEREKEAKVITKF
eukprot:TRINITY_DN75741_c0_g1_i1.p1 TRINITY_DN75741_c0_g1~~TRINITY_DN75741_c0_g1_i1.p1  ORF type:complete len:200 (-),score=57.09 TRINITY_DN75741_c0_g1_i1:71-670(-)